MVTGLHTPLTQEGQVVSLPWCYTLSRCLVQFQSLEQLTLVALISIVALSEED